MNNSNPFRLISSGLLTCLPQFQCSRHQDLLTVGLTSPLSGLYGGALCIAHASYGYAPLGALELALPGKPIVKGTRITVELILEKLSGGESMEDILEAHPRLTREGIYSALDYVSKVLKTDIVELLPERKHAVRR